ncbi:MAG: TIGR04100 family radical SAM protein [Clostridia bacterium]
MNNILYTIGNKLYLNITNKCPCACTFCIRTHKDNVGNSNPLWLEREPTCEEVIAQLETRDLDSYEEIVFCGFGEPLVRIDAVCEIAKFLKNITKTPIKINTNGLCNLLHKRDITPDFQTIIDIISISLNASNKEDYLEITKSKFGIESFDSMLDFAQKSKLYVKDVVLSVVDVIGEEEIEKCRKICQNIDVTFRVRKFES